MKPTAVWIVAAICLALPTAGEGAAWLGRLDEAVSRAEETGQLILVDLYAEWCGWCKRLEEAVYSKTRFLQFAEDFVLLRVDTEDRGEGSGLADRFGVSTLPTLLILDARLVKVGEVQGFAPLEPYIARIREEIAFYRRLEKSFAAVGPDTERRALSVLAHQFHDRRDGRKAVDLYDRLLALPELSPEEERLTRYLLVDALRMSRRFERAARELDGMRRATDPERDSDLLAQLDLVQAELARQRGDCQEAALALKSFLRSNPNSPFRKEARRTLRSLEAGSPECT